MGKFILNKGLASFAENLKKMAADCIYFFKTKIKNSSVRNKPMFCSGNGMFVMKPDFDEPLEDFKDYM